MPILIHSQAQGQFWDRTHSDPPTFCNTNFLLRRSHKDSLAPPTQKVKFCEHSSNLFRCMQNCTFSFTMQLQEVNIEGESYK